jgi:hypothetical protein
MKSINGYAEGALKPLIEPLHFLVVLSFALLDSLGPFPRGPLCQ